MTESSFIVFFESDERPPVRGGTDKEGSKNPLEPSIPGKSLSPPSPSLA